MKKTNYQTPAIEVLDVELEGVLCASGDSSIEGLDEGVSFGY